MLPRPLYWHKYLAAACLVCLFWQSRAQDTLSVNYKLRKQIVVSSNTLAYTGTMIGLYHLWYKDYPWQKFHFFNDNYHWQQMDKVGHAYTCYYEGVAGIEMMKWAGYSKKQYSLIGGSYGFLIQTGVEIFDGFSAGWGASLGDVAANSFGSALVIAQSLAWDEQRFWLKYSYSASPYAQVRPSILGESLTERMLKDYNGQTYWLSTNISAWLRPESKWPTWLNLAVGYGADGMVGGRDNTFIKDGIEYDYTQIFDRTRQFYLSPDIDLTRVKTKRKGLRALLIVANCIKIPLPTIEYDTGKGLKAHFFHF